jgi:hypothetical protein
LWIHCEKKPPISLVPNPPLISMMMGTKVFSSSDINVDNQFPPFFNRGEVWSKRREFQCDVLQLNPSVLHLPSAITHNPTSNLIFTTTKACIVDILRKNHSVPFVPNPPRTTMTRDAKDFHLVPLMLVTDFHHSLTEVKGGQRDCPLQNPKPSDDHLPNPSSVVAF